VSSKAIYLQVGGIEKKQTTAFETRRGAHSNVESGKEYLPGGRGGFGEKAATSFNSREGKKSHKHWSRGCDLLS